MYSIDHGNPSPEEICSALREAPLVAIREKLKDRDILDACRTCGHTFRRRRYDPVVTVFHFLAQALGREASFAATFQELWTPLLAAFPEMDVGPFNTSGLTHARARLPGEVMQILAANACAESAEIELSRWKGFRLLALDASTVSMPREPQLFERFGAHRARTTTVRYPLGTLGVLLSVGSSLMLDYRFGPFDPGEKKTCTPLLSHLRKGDMLLADRGFAGSPFLARTKATGADFLMRKNARLKVQALPVIKKLGRDDFITEMPMNKPARRKDPTLPKTVRVRIFKAAWETPAGEQLTEWFVTSLEDARRFRKRTLAMLYHQRWRIETTYIEFKQWFHADVLRSKTVNNIEKEFAAHVLAYQLLRLLMAAAAEKHNKKPTELSILNAARWVVHFSHRMSTSPAWLLPVLYERLLDAIACHEIDIRPGRLEPRALTREWKHYPHLRISRTQWRQQRLRRTA